MSPTPPTTPGPPAKRPRHLMDPDNPVRPRNDAALSKVQRTVMSVLVATTMLHLVVGLVVAAAFVDQTSGKVGLLVISAAFGVIGAVATLAIHKRSPLSPWLLAGVVPSIAGAFWVLG